MPYTDILGIWECLRGLETTPRTIYWYSGHFRQNITPIYSIPLKGYPQLRGHRIVHRGRMNMIETVLESSNLGHQENIYIVGVISYRFFENQENKIFLEN